VPRASNGAWKLRFARFQSGTGPTERMNIRFTSSLTPEDENLLAPALLRAVSSLLELLPIAYVIRIDTSDSRIYQQSGPSGYSQSFAEPVRLRLAERTGVSREGS
jgi:hypothetical protein